MVRLEDIEVGDNLYFNTDSNRRGKAVVDRIYTEPGMAPAIGMKTRHSTFTVQLHNLFATQRELTEYVKDLEEKCFRERLEKIKTVEDLVRFMYDNTVSEADEYTDEDGRRIAAMKAKELLGIDLDARGT